MLVQNLPPDSAVVRETGQWAPESYVLADLIDAVNLLRYESALRAGAKGARQPAPYPRPNKVAEESARREQSAASAVAYMEQYRAQKEA